MATGKALAGPSSFWFFLQESATPRACRSAAAAVLPQPQTIQHPPVQPINSLGPIQRPPHSPAQFRLKKASSVGAVCGNDSSYISITDFSVLDGIDSEHKQEQRSKDAKSTRRRGQQASRASRSDAGQYERSGSTPPRQPTLDRRARTTHHTNTASTRDASDLGRS